METGINRGENNEAIRGWEGGALMYITLQYLLREDEVSAGHEERSQPRLLYRVNHHMTQRIGRRSDGRGKVPQRFLVASQG